MKLRNGFVSNSSTSSFTCDICLNTESGYDLCPSECGMSECMKGHMFCNDHQEELSLEMKKQIILDYGNLSDSEKKELNIVSEEEIKDWFVENDIATSGYEVPSEFCPLCQMIVIRNDEMLTYLYDKLRTDKKSVTAEIKERFGTYTAFNTWLESIKPSKI